MVRNILLLLFWSFPFLLHCCPRRQIRSAKDNDPGVHTCLHEIIRATSQSQKRFSQNQLLKYCQRKTEWRHELISKTTGDSVKLTENQKKWFVELSTMRSMQSFEEYWRRNALSPDRGSRKQLLAAHRREVRTLTMDEWSRFIQALERMKHDQIDGKNKYDILTIIHSSRYSPGSLFGPAFLPYHREFLKDFELALRLYDAEVALPYWDSTMDEGLPAPTDAVIWTKAFFGNIDGYLNSGPFKSWKTLNSVYNEPRIVREGGRSPYGGLLRSEDLQTIMSKTKYEELTTCVDPFFELVYGGVTLWVGGHMKSASAAPEDPVFYLHHAFTDLLWEQFRQKRQTKEQRETDYPEDSKSCNRDHYASTTMQPFQIKNRDGLADLYTQEFYTYDVRPTCSDVQPSCRSPYLFCHVAKSRCMGKVKLGGSCVGFENTDICYEGHCLEGKCQGNAEPIPELTPPDNVGNGNQEKNGQQTIPADSDCSCNCDCSASDGKKLKYIKTLPSSMVVGKVSKDYATVHEKEKDEPAQSIDTEWVWIIVNVINRNASPQSKGGTITVKATGTDYVGSYSTTLPEQAKHPALLPGSVPIQVKNPRFGRGKTQVEIKATHSQTGKCESYCRQSKELIGFKPCGAEITLTERKNRGDVALFPYASKISDLVSMEKQFPSGSLIFICGTNEDAVAGKVNLDEASASSKCYFLRFEHFLLAGYADAVKQSLSSSECKNFCRTWRSPTGKGCSSLMHWEDDGTCVLLMENRKTLPHAFVFLPSEPVTYFEMICSLSKDMFEL